MDDKKYSYFLAYNQILIMIFNNKGIESTCGLNVYSAVA